MFLSNVCNVDDAVDRKVVEYEKKRHHRSFNLQKLSLGNKNKMPIMMKTNLRISFPCTENIQLPSVSLQSAENIQASYIILEATKTNPAVAEIFAVQVMDIKFFANFVITPLA